MTEREREREGKGRGREGGEEKVREQRVQNPILTVREDDEVPGERWEPGVQQESL